MKYLLLLTLFASQSFAEFTERDKELQDCQNKVMSLGIVYEESTKLVTSICKIALDNKEAVRRVKSMCKSGYYAELQLKNHVIVKK